MCPQPVYFYLCWLLDDWQLGLQVADLQNRKIEVEADNKFLDITRNLAFGQVFLRKIQLPLAKV